MEQKNHRTGLEIAVIGMSGRFPGARNIHRFWENLTDGVESISFFSEEELEKAGIHSGLIKNLKYIKAKGVVEGIEYFDSYFFDYSPREAEIMDPQVRIFHECAWEALEDAGYNTSTYDGAIGLYAGASPHLYWKALTMLSGKSGVMSSFDSTLKNEKDFLSLHISYKLNLKGPAISIYTACSTSLVAIHLGCRALLTGECNMSLAGGVTLEVPIVTGYMHQEGMILSPDGHCRAFDRKANGTLGGNGAGIVVLKPLAAAEADRDHIYAVIKGSAVNNDGEQKVGFTAPGLDGQAAVLQRAFHMAEINPQSISYIEAHGTGTALGDSAEIEALKLVFNSGKKGSCAIGSVKSNIGHLDSAAGAAGFIKTVLALNYRLIPPSLHFETPNSTIDFENSPFYVNTKLRPWKSEKYPRRAGVSSFGIGGTNAHVILEEAPGTDEGRQTTDDRGQSQGRGGVSPPGPSREYQLILLSAKTGPVLENMTKALVAHFKNNPGINLADAAYTLQVGRRTFKSRRMLTCSNVNEAIDLLSSGAGKVKTYYSKEDQRDIVFMFSGLGAQYRNMGRELYEQEPLFRQEMNRCFEILEPLVDYNIKEILYPDVMCSGGYPYPPKDCVGFPGQGDYRESPLQPDQINQTEIAQLVVFILEYSLARLLMAWGINPRAMIGYSFGEYAAACISGVFSLEDALQLIVSRGNLIGKLPGGVMLSVPLTREELNPFLNEGLSLAVDNGPSCIVAGPPETVQAFERRMKENKLMCMPVPSDHALHSKMMEPILTGFSAKIGKLTLNKPKIPYISNVTGTWIIAEQATSPTYWATHLRQTVRFAEGIKELVKDETNLFVEVGPGRDLSTLVQRYIQKDSHPPVVYLLRQSRGEGADIHFLLDRIGRLWLYGISLDWEVFYKDKKRSRISLPTYPFDSLHYPVPGSLSKIFAGMDFKRYLPRRITDIKDWFYIPLWEQSPLPVPGSLKNLLQCHWLIFCDETGLGDRLEKRLKEMGADVIAVRRGPGFTRSGKPGYTLHPSRENHYKTLFHELLQLKKFPCKLIHLWSVTGKNAGGPALELLADDLDSGFYSLLSIVQALGTESISENIEIYVVTDNMQKITGDEELCPQKATVLGAVKIIPLEYTNVKCCSIDVVLPESGSRKEDRLVDSLLVEFQSDPGAPVAAYRGAHRWVPVLKPYPLDRVEAARQRLKQEGVYLITGGLGAMGLTLAGYLAKQVKARLVLTGRSAFPAREEWEQWLAAHDKDDPVSSKIMKVRELEKAGAEVMVFSADIANRQQMEHVVARTRKRFGPINGVLHAAGAADYKGVIQRRTRQMTESILAPKVRGTLVLERVLKGMNPDFLILFSSIGNFLYQVKFGQVGYNAANEFLDAYASYSTAINGRLTTTINWTDWLERGMAIEAINRAFDGESDGANSTPIDYGAFLENAMSPAEGIEVFHRVLGTRLTNIAVSTLDLNMMMEEMERRHENNTLHDHPYSFKEKETLAAVGGLQPRPRLDVEYAAPVSETEHLLCRLWQEFFGIRGIGIDDDFFDLGGDSLKAMTAAAHIHKQTGVRTPMAEFFKTPTIKGLSRFIEVTKSEMNTSIPLADDKEYRAVSYSSVQPTETKEFYALSSAQKRLYVQQQIDLENTAYNTSLAVVLQGRLEKVDLENTCRKLIARHESLRTSFEIVEGEPVQLIHNGADFEIEYHAAGNRDQADITSIINNFERPFDLSRVPLMRVGLINVEEEKHILMLDMHHIVCDGISIVLLVQGLICFYSGEELPELRIQYKDFSEWQNSKKEEESIKRQEDYWLGEFEGEIPSLNLPMDFSRSEAWNFEGDLIHFEIDTYPAGALKKLAAEEGATSYMVLLTLFNVLLAKITGQEDIVVGTVVAGRADPELEPIIGMFVNTLALRNFPRMDKPFRDFLGEVKERTLRAFENQDYQLEDLVDKIALKQNGSNKPLFSALFTLQNFAFEPVEKPKKETTGLQIKNYPYKSSTSKFDLMLEAVEQGDRFSFTFEYKTKLFKKETIERFIRHFKEMVSSVLQDPRQPLGEIEIISKETAGDLIKKFKQEKDSPPVEKTRENRKPREKITADFDY
jgi:acyl transferase domain-containing protein/acyl carrier protein